MFVFCAPSSRNGKELIQSAGGTRESEIKHKISLYMFR